MPLIHVNNIDLYYEEQGQGEPVILIAGFSADHNAWRFVVDYLKQQFRVIVLDNRGVGQSSVPPGSYSIDIMAHDVAGLCQQLNIHRAHFIGSSMGGFIVQQLAYRYPDLVKSIIISNSTYFAQGCFKIYVEAQLELLQSQAPLPALVKANSAWVYSYQFLSQPDTINNLIKIAVDNPYPVTMEGYRSQLAALIQFDSREWLNQIQVPALVIGGDQDIIFAPSTVKALAEQLPKARYICFDNCGHLPFIEYPKQFIHCILPHLRG